MSGVINKVKEAVGGHHGSEDTANHGPHSSKLANKLDPRVDNSRDYTTPGAAGSETTTIAHPPTYGTSATNAGPHDSNIMNKVDPRVDSDRDNRARHAQMGGSYGPHSSDLANKADPRVDSDRDNRSAGGLYSGTPGGAGLVEEERHVKPAGFPASGDHTTTKTFSMSQNESTSSGNHGPHSSSIANKLDPRVDSDRDGRARHETMGAGGLNTAGGGYGTTSSTGAGLGSTNHGTHDSNVMNKMDPRFDSDRDHRARHETLGSSGYNTTTAGSGYTTGTTGPTGMGTSSTNHGSHDSNMMNKMDPRFDSDRDGRARPEVVGQSGYNTTVPAGSSYSTGTTKTTAGPHDSNLVNKMDPRVDSDLDSRQTGTQRGYGL